MNLNVNLAALSAALISLGAVAVGAVPRYDPLERSITFGDTERVYYVVLPRPFTQDAMYWPLVVVHGGGGNARTNTKAIAMSRIANQMNLPAIMILPEFITKDKQVSRFPDLGEADFLKAVLREARAEFKLRDKVLLTGSSMGGQFTHRFALANPGMIQACAPLSAGTWTTPDGRLLIETYGEVKDPKAFLSSPENANKVPERLSNLFDARTAAIAGLPAAEGAQDVPFLVMCGTLDTRLNIAREFAASLRESGYRVETGWPRTPHGSKGEEFKSEFEKYPDRVIRFFNKHISD